MLTFTNDDLRGKLQNDTGADASSIDFLPFSDLEGSVRDDMKRIKESPFIPQDIPVRGFVYDVHTGKLTEVSGEA
jgi:carbonic anhydrase